MLDLNDGFLVINKPKGISSRQLVDKIKRRSNTKVGHTGTLDPLASGMMILCIGDATKFSQWVISKDKAYEADVQFGSQTDTDDLEGETIATSDNLTTQQALEKLLPKYHGKIAQVPPKYSAIHINGQRAYKLARQNKEFAIPKRDITIHEIKCLHFNQSAQTATFYIHCQSGTYIRSIARDIGIDLKCYAHLADLKRIWVNPFKDYHTYDIDDDTMETISLDEYFKKDGKLPMAQLSHTQAKDLAFGRTIKLTGSEKLAAFYQNKFIGVIEPHDDQHYKSTKLRANVIDFIS